EGGVDIGGGGIYNAGGLTLGGVTVSDSAISSDRSFPSRTPPGGGGIQNDGLLTMSDCTVSNNTASPPVEGATSDGGRGGGVLNKGTLAMTNCTVSLNHTGDGGLSPNAGNGGAGGGIYNAAHGTRQVSASLTNCLVNGNTTGNGSPVPVRFNSSHSGDGGNGGGIYNASDMTIVRSTISNNLTGIGASVPSAGPPQPLPIPAGKGGAGGGIYNDIPSGGGELKMTNCVVVGNKTGAGGAGNGEVQSHGDGGDGGGVASPSADSVLKMSQCTVVRNQTGLAGDGGGRDGVGGGVYGFPRIRSNIIATNVVHFPTNFGDVAGGPPVSLGYNYFGFFGSLSNPASTDRGGAGGAAATFLMLDPFTLIPQEGSVIIDVGLARDADDQPVTTDRRGAARPVDFPAVAPQSGGDDGDIGAFERQAAEPTPTPTTVQFTSAGANVAEDCAQADIIVTRSGPKGGTTVATYVVADSVAGAHQRGDFTYAKGQVTFAPGEDLKSIPVLITEDAYHEQPETFVVSITEVAGGQPGTPNATVVVIDDDDAADGTTNPIDDNATFVCQHYHDFLGRHADAGGQAFWTARLDECGTDAACLDRKRVDVSAAFFLSIEFLNTGYFVIRVNAAARRLGAPDYFTFLGDARDVARGVVVGQPGFEAALEANKRRYTEAFVQRANFQSTYAGLPAERYVDSLFSSVGVTPTTAEHDAAVSAFGAGGMVGQAAALRSVVELGSVFNRLYNEAFVRMQYYGYLRRNPNGPPDNNLNGYNFWLNKLNSATLPGEDARDETVAIRRIRRAEIIRAFLRSTEYRGRFAGDPSRGNP
ncbi:MAG TPA: Calx-beta domain-containing protein, partial [Pyrinomonadaceae bacterium]|nr:Calx-beta domain-containing protein [Pyrinomonadaceae bacterium]